MAYYSPELKAGFPSKCRQLPSVLISSSSFCPSLCQVTRQLFPSSLVRVLWAVAFEYNSPVDAVPPSGPTNTFYSVSVFLFFPRVFLRVLVCFSPGSTFFSRRFFRLLVRTVFSLVLCHDAVFGWSDRPASSILLSPFASPAQLLRGSSLGLYTLQLLHHLANRLKSVQPRELQASRLA